MHVLLDDIDLSLALFITFIKTLSLFLNLLKDLLDLNQAGHILQIVLHSKSIQEPLPLFWRALTHDHLVNEVVLLALNFNHSSHSRTTFELGLQFVKVSHFFVLLYRQLLDLEPPLIFFFMHWFRCFQTLHNLFVDQVLRALTRRVLQYMNLLLQLHGRVPEDLRP